MKINYKIALPLVIIVVIVLGVVILSRPYSAYKSRSKYLHGLEFPVPSQQIEYFDDPCFFGYSATFDTHCNPKSYVNLLIDKNQTIDSAINKVTNSLNSQGIVKIKESSQNIESRQYAYDNSYKNFNYTSYQVVYLVSKKLKDCNYLTLLANDLHSKSSVLQGLEEIPNDIISISCSYKIPAKNNSY